MPGVLSGAGEGMERLLTYFNVRGRAEVIRLLLEETATPYRERRVEVHEWPELKPTMPFGQMPIYEEGDLFICQSHAIYRHLARIHNLYGRNEREHVRCDMIEEVFVDAQNVVAGFMWRPDFAEKRAEFERTTLTESLTRLERMFVQNRDGTGYWVGDDLTFVDFLMWHHLDYIRPLSQATLERFVALYAFKKRIEARPRIAAYLKSSRRPATLTVSMAPFGGTPETS
jgi:glutathione S-transferase